MHFKRIPKAIACAAMNAKRTFGSILRHNLDPIHQDPLTGVHNRNAFNQRLGKADGAYTLVLIDIDDFKKINDTYGHQEGDEALKRVTSAIREKIDRIYRLGGEEFAILLDCGLEAARTIANRICKRVALERVVDTTVSVSIGVAQRAENQNHTETYKAADAALYSAKSNGKNQVAVATV